jgi:golgi phosphoprotein 3
MMMISLVEELALLTIEDDGSLAPTADSVGFRFCMIGACLIELNQLGRIDVDLEAIHVLSREPVGHAALDLVLQQLHTESPQPATAQIRRLSAFSDDLIDLAIGSLVQRGIIDQQEKRFLWVLKTRRYPVIDGKEQTEAKLRILSLLLSDDLPTPHDSVLIGLADAGGVLEGFLSGTEIARLQDRLQQIGSLDLIARCVEKAIQAERELMGQISLIRTF